MFRPQKLGDLVFEAGQPHKWQAFSKNAWPANEPPIDGSTGVVHDLLVLGAGPAGATAALYAARAGLAPVVFAAMPDLDQPNLLPGGQLATTSLVENYPGFPDGIDGTELTFRFQDHAARYGAQIRTEKVLRVDLGTRPFTIETDSERLQARALIIATGASARWLGVPGEAEYRNRGVSGCATCDGPLFAGRDVVVVGGGDSALEEASYLARIARSVTVIHRRPELSASHSLQQRVRAEPRIELVLDSVVEELQGDGQALRGVRLRSQSSGETTLRRCDGVFIAIGREPATALFEHKLQLTPRGYVATVPGSTHTSVAGVFACGDVQDERYRQAVTSAGSGCMAALDAERWLSQQRLLGAPVKGEAA